MTARPVVSSPPTSPVEGLDLAAIEARAAAATPGPWHRDERYVVGGEGIGDARPGGEVIVQAQPTRHPWPDYDLPMKIANAEFIAHARSDVPALVAEVKRLREDNASAYAAGHSAGYSECMRDWQTSR